MKLTDKQYLIPVAFALVFIVTPFLLDYDKSGTIASLIVGIGCTVAGLIGAFKKPKK